LSNRRHVYLLPGQEVGHSQKLYLRILLVPHLRFIESRRDGFRLHGFGGVFHGNQDAYRGLFPLDHAAQIAHVIGRDVPGLHGQDNRLELPGPVALEHDRAVNALVRALLAFHRTRAHKTQRPPLNQVAAREGRHLARLLAAQKPV